MNKSEYIQLRVSSDVKAALMERAASAGMTASEYIRFLIFEDLRRNDVLKKEA